MPVFFYGLIPKNIWTFDYINEFEPLNRCVFRPRCDEDLLGIRVYLEGPTIAKVSKHPACNDIRPKQFGVIDAFSAITRAPVLERHLIRRPRE